jgi:hypothetical protein
MSAFQGDVVFQAPRRWMVENKVTVNVWVYGMSSIPFSRFLDSTHFLVDTVSKRLIVIILSAARQTAKQLESQAS